MNNQYQPPYIDSTGLHLPTYTDILNDLISQFKAIYGQDIYLENDSQDYQMISAFALKIYDNQQALALVYNNNSPATAIGTGLDRNIAVNGIKRKSATYSTCPVTLFGTSGATVKNGVVQDVNGVNWNLPESVTITQDGSVIVTATCTVLGPTTASPGDINKIVTPTYGWTSVVNNIAATPGQAVETDSQVRARQAQSVAIPSRGLFEGTLGAVAAVSGATRFKGYENDTGNTSSTGLPPHSITMVVEGGADMDIAQAIYLHKAPGCYTNGQEPPINIPLSDGSTMPIRFYRPTYVSIQIHITIQRLTNYTSALKDQIIQNVQEYVNNLAIGEDVYVSNLYGPILSAMPDIRMPAFAVTALTGNITGQSTAAMLDIGILQVAKIDLKDITITAV